MNGARLSELLSRPWAIEPAVGQSLLAIITRHEAGIRLDGPAIRAAVGDAPAMSAARREHAGHGRGVMVLPLYGVLGHRAHLVRQTSSGVGTSTEMLGRALDLAAADSNVAAIVLDIDSPGGSVEGVTELHAKVLAARARKPVVAVANATAASAAYWIASAASEVVVTTSGQVGSVGVIATHRYRDGANADGERVEFVSAGRFKAEVSPAEPLGPEARRYVQSLVDAAYETMVADIARGRGTSVDAVRRAFGEGRLVPAQDAVRRGMADRIETLDAVLARLTRAPAPRAVGGTGMAGRLGRAQVAAGGSRAPLSAVRSTTANAIRIAEAASLPAVPVAPAGSRATNAARIAALSAHPAPRRRQ